MGPNAAVTIGNCDKETREIMHVTRKRGRKRKERERSFQNIESDKKQGSA
jgi:hypothetical protein